MSHLDSTSRRGRRARALPRAALVTAARGTAAAGPAQARPIGPCDGPCTPPPPPPPAAQHPALHSCANRDWMTRAGGGGSGSSFVVRMQPTFRARVFVRDIKGKRFVEYIWRDRHRCVHFPANLTSAQKQ